MSEGLTYEKLKQAQDALIASDCCTTEDITFYIPADQLFDMYIDHRPMARLRRFLFGYNKEERIAYDRIIVDRETP